MSSKVILTESQLKLIVPSNRNIPALLPHIQAGMDRFEISKNNLRVAGYIAQLAHESVELRVFEENLNYSAEGLVKTWPRRFLSLEFAQRYHRQPQKIANYVYADRMGNGGVASGDGWKHRGFGPIQLTGKDAHRACGDALGVDLVGNPELLGTPEIGFQSSAWFWSVYKPGLNSLAERRDVREMTRVVNGGTNGLADRMRLYALACKALGVD